VCYKNNLIEWLFKFDPALNDDDRKPLVVDKYYTLQEGVVSEIMYDHYMQELLLGTEEGYVLMIPQPAEANVDDLDDDQAGDKTPSDDENKKEEKQLELEVKKVGPFHTAEIVYLKEMKILDILVSVSRDGMVFIWNLVESKLAFSLYINLTLNLLENVITSYHYHSETNKAQISNDDKLLVLGSSQGCVRIIDITDLANFQVRKIYRFFKTKEISSICINSEKSLISCSSQRSKKVFFISANQDHDYKIIGFSMLPDKINSVSWLETPKHPIPTSSNVLLVVVNYLLIVVVPPNPNNKYNNIKLELDQCPQYGRKIDPDLHLIAVDPTSGDIFLTGRDKILKKYKQPDELIIKMDLRIKVPGSIPIEELDGHALSTNCLLIAPNNALCASGGVDGSIFLRNLKTLSNVTEIKAHNYKSNGVSALTFSHNSYILYSGGKDGSLFLWELYPYEFSVTFYCFTFF
jgi:WD40 repeat protein